MDKAQNKNDSAYNVIKYLMGMLMLAFVIFLLAFFLFSCSKDDQTARAHVVSFGPKGGYVSQQKENAIVTIGNITDLGVITIQ